MHAWVNYLADYLTVGEAYGKSIFGSVILVLRGVSKELTSLIVGFSLSASTEASLVSSEVAFGLYHLYEAHLLMNIWIGMKKVINVWGEYNFGNKGW